jgi:hypothetical protein
MAPLGHGGRRLRGLLALPRARDRGAGPAGWLRLGSSLFDLSSKSRRVWSVGQSQSVESVPEQQNLTASMV